MGIGLYVGMIDWGPYRGKDLVAPKPTIVAEVLSPSTRATNFLVNVARLRICPIDLDICNSLAG